MNLKQFDKIVTDQLSRSELVLMGKAVSYTHLDVYKRQPTSLSKMAQI